jgi:pSer/pThr/pTyr-binding forkhead associated (FHA) protein
MFRVTLQPILGAPRSYEPDSDSIVIDQFPFVIGRHNSCDFRLDMPQISRWHCRFLDTGTEVEIQDLDSRNGTFLNNLRVQAPQRIRTGDILMLGRTQFRVDIWCCLELQHALGQPGAGLEVPALH